MMKHAQRLHASSSSSSSNSHDYHCEMPTMQQRWRCSWHSAMLSYFVALLATTMPFAVAWHAVGTKITATTVSTTLSNTVIEVAASTTTKTATAIETTATTINPTELVNNISAIKGLQEQQQQQLLKFNLSNIAASNQQQSISSNQSCCYGNANTNRSRSEQKEKSESFNRIFNEDENFATTTTTSSAIKSKQNQVQRTVKRTKSIHNTKTTTTTSSSGPIHLSHSAFNESKQRNLSSNNQNTKYNNKTKNIKYNTNTNEDNNHHKNKINNNNNTYSDKNDCKKNNNCNNNSSTKYNNKKKPHTRNNLTNNNNNKNNNNNTINSNNTNNNNKDSINTDNHNNHHMVSDYNKNNNNTDGNDNNYNINNKYVDKAPNNNNNNSNINTYNHNKYHKNSDNNNRSTNSNSKNNNYNNTTYNNNNNISYNNTYNKIYNSTNSKKTNSNHNYNNNNNEHNTYKNSNNNNNTNAIISNQVDNQNAITSSRILTPPHENLPISSPKSTQSQTLFISEPNQLLWNWKFNRTKTKRFSQNIRRNRNDVTVKTTALTPSVSSYAPSFVPAMMPTTTHTRWSHLSFLHPATSAAAAAAAAASKQLKVNQVFESERRMTHRQMQRNHGKIVLLGLFELSTRNGPRPDGLSELGAAMMAVEHINRKHLLPGYTLELVTNDTQCDPGVGVDRFFHAIYTQPATRMVMLLGSACSEVTESLAKVVPYWNIVQVSFGSTSPALSDRQEFPYFYRTVAPDSSHNPARIAFIRRFGWDTVTTFSQNEEVHSLAVNDLVTELEAANISCAATITFAETDFKEQLLLLRETDTRIIIGSFSQLLAPKILCEAYKLRMFGADYAWILHESMGAPWWNEVPALGTHCSTKELQEAVENLIIVSSHNSIVGNNISLSGLSNDMFNTQLRKQSAQFTGTMAATAKDTTTTTTTSTATRRRQEQNQQNMGSFGSRAGDDTVPGNMPTTNIMSRYAPQTYDAVWAIALALRAAEEHWRRDAAVQAKLDRFDYTRSDMAWEFLKQMGKLDFLGVSGPVSFSGPDRIGTTAFYQIQQGILEPVALFYPAENTLDFHCPRCRSVKWHSGEVPIAKRVFKVRVATIAPLAFYTIATLSSVGIALAIAFLAFNLHFRKLKAIKLSSPKLSNITAVGCIFVYAAVILLGLDYSTLPSAEDSFATVCTARVYLLSAGFSLAFGSMFAKTYRVHRIFTRTGSVFKDKMLQDIQLILLVCALLLVDGLVVTLWVVTDPMERHLNNLTLEISSIDRSVVYQPQVEVCRSQHTQTWLGALYAYKGLLLVVGVYMAWETRHVKIAALNDSQYIGVSVYSVVITSGIVVVLANLISERVTLSFITITALILTSTTATLCLLFIPKLHDIWARNDIIDPVIHSMGLKMECNTRRFVLDDRRELQYRVEVQNRVYKKEIAALDAEIRKLERMLESGTASTTTSSTTSLMFGQQKPGVTVTSESLMQFPQPPTTHKSSNKSRTPSISGILPNLLLSVLPPVIPRASWPSAEYMQVPMRRSVTFASQPQLEDRSITDACLPAQDLLNLRLAHQQATEAKTSIIERLRGIFTRTTSSNKGSTNSLSEQKGLKAAFKSHMGLFTRLIPSSQTASCNAIYNVALPEEATGSAVGPSTSRGSSHLKPMQRLSFAKSGTHLDVTPIDPNFLPIPLISTISTETSSALPSIDIGGKYIKAHETKVNFALPSHRRPSNVSMALQPSLRERVRGSPRFPHRILPPTCSLSALEETTDRGLESKKERTSLQQASSVGNWKSMEVAAKSRMSLNDSQQDLPAEVNLVIETQLEVEKT